MKLPLSEPLRRLGRYWLVNHPLLWIMQLHWMVYRFLLGFLLIGLVALTLPIEVSSITSLHQYFNTTLALAGIVVLGPWFLRQASASPQLRQSSQVRTAVYLLVVYFFISGLYLVWPYALVGILEARISSRIDESALERDFHTLLKIKSYYDLPKPNWKKPLPEKPLHASRDLERLLQKYKISDFEGKDLDPRMFEYYLDDALVLLCRAGQIKGSPFSRVVPCNEIADELLRPLTYLMWMLFFVLLLRIFQSGGEDSFLHTALIGMLLFVATVFCASYFKSMVYYIISFLLLLLFFGGVYAAIRAPHLERKVNFFGIGLNIFTLLLPIAPALFYSFFLFILVPGGVHDPSVLSLLLGMVLSIAASPEIQRRYLAFQAKPS